MTADDLFAAIDAGQLDAVRAIVAGDPSVASSRDGDGVSAVMHALYRGQRPAAEATAEHVPSLDVFEAASLDRAEVLEMLLGRDPSLTSAWSVDGFTALHFAAFFGGGAAARTLLAAGADPNLRSRNDFAVMPIHSAVAGRHGVVVAALLDAGADPNVHQRHGWTPLQGAAEHGDVESVDRLLAAGADVAATNDDGVTAAELARRAGHGELADRLSAFSTASSSVG
ncbi:MAG TPA: ankyrin repeat domain-containing protein [Candidatus Limnocylindrales bacterium]|nr:ankyrin repeat domain-containing protein [Candidatus Limnocylindrales bacterium]